MCLSCFRGSSSSSKVIEPSSSASPSPAPASALTSSRVTASSLASTSAAVTASTSASAAASSSSSPPRNHEASNQSKGSHRDHQSHLLGRTPSMTGRGKSKRSPVPVRYGFSLVKGKSKRAMEDYHVAEFRQVKHGPHHMEVGLFAIFDGHMGHNVSSYLQRHLFNSILQQPNFWDDPKNAITDAYALTDVEIISKAKDLGKGGSTAVTAIVVDGQMLVVANIGDSRAVLCRKGLAFQLSIDHDPSVEEEKNSIEDFGGFVSNIPGDVPRVDGQLAVSRAFGDKSLKMHMRADPYIVIENIDEMTEFLILASDGLWKVVTNQEAVDLARPIKDVHAAAKLLTHEALVRNSRDDISCIVVRFRQ